jgi:hypothetical protein
MREFELYHLINVNNRKITTPASQVALALSFIKGPKVDTWVFNQAKQLALHLYGDQNNPITHHPSNEALWNGGGVAYWSTCPRVQRHCGGGDLWSRRGPGFKPAFGHLWVSS